MDLNKAYLIPARIFLESLAKSPVDGKHQLEPFMTWAKEMGIPVNVLEDHNFNVGAPEVHRHEEDVWIGVEGEAKFIVGGELVEPWTKEGDDREVKGKSIRGGEEVKMGQWDFLRIPAGQPHQHTALHGRLIIIKLPAKEIFPLERVPGWKK